MNEEARKRAEILSNVEFDECIEFPYAVHTMLQTDADLIESLSAQLDQVTRERDAAVEDLRGYCSTCVFKKPCIVTGCVGDMGEACKQCPCLDCANGRKWQWRGAEKEVEG